MRAVRCEVCGSRAMTAAAQCPTCSHPFTLRDGFGELLPLAYCASCDSYYRETLDECRWCGTKPHRAPIAAKVWRGVGAAALVVIVGTALFLRDTGAPDTPRKKTKTATKSHSEPLPTDTALARTTATVADTSFSSSLPTTMASADSIRRDSVPRAEPMSQVSRDTTVPAIAPPIAPAISPAAAPRRVASMETTMPPSVPRAIASVEPTVPTPAPIRSSVASKPAESSPKPAARASSKSRRSAPWVSSVSRHWVVIRSDASKRSRIVASIGPHSHVQLGESRGEWRRIRAKGLAGWVEQSSAFVEVATR